ncbi:glycosyltransferase [Rhodococcus hoagii]|uniref:glycosyltransferase family 2 protein n=1 Tax=Rhodococcus hoagii TaxID=43767 RepID=UPI0011A6262E|nr:glycosyltransferase family 2 protein [Prescottella equi]MBM4588798.1 glycosyltransferase [Prescottella equi]MBM4692554.1 glycosyltransferase [Prescottella equi]NKR32301.1 glycosyltransferase [Prescottella equi]NKR53531.1 glycosyltransferase [Prescottella equi]NKS58865.1 glycosyltransferase [Prescottella equi]
MPRISVILPVKNGERFVRSAVRSTLAAMPRDSELVVLDDASTDCTAEVLATLQDRRLKVVHGTESSGLAAGLNRLISLTDSEWIARMDADDISLPWRFSEQRTRMEAGADFIFSPVIHLGPSRFRIRPTRLGRVSSENAPFLLLLENPFAHSTAMFRRKAIERLGLYRSVGAEDYDVWLRAAARGYLLERTANPVLLYRHHSEQVTKDAAWKARSRTEEMLVESHSALSQTLLGISGDSISALRTGDAPRGVAMRADGLVKAIERRFSEAQSGPETRRIRRTCESAKGNLARRYRMAQC